MIYIPAHVYKDDTLGFECPEFWLDELESRQVFYAMSDIAWPAILAVEGFICSALRRSGHRIDALSVALRRQYGLVSVDACVAQITGGTISPTEHAYIVQRIRAEWCRHIRATLEEKLA